MDTTVATNAIAGSQPRPQFAIVGEGALAPVKKARGLAEIIASVDRVDAITGKAAANLAGVRAEYGPHGLPTWLRYLTLPLGEGVRTALAGALPRKAVELEALGALATAHQNSVGRPLERAALAQLCRDALAKRETDQIYYAPASLSLLERIAGEGTAVAQSEVDAHERLERLIAAVRNVEAPWPLRSRASVALLVTALKELTDEEHGSVAPELLARLFTRNVPNPGHIDFKGAGYIRAALSPRLAKP